MINLLHDYNQHIGKLAFLLSRITINAVKTQQLCFDWIYCNSNCLKTPQGWNVVYKLLCIDRICCNSDCLKARWVRTVLKLYCLSLMHSAYFGNWREISTWCNNLFIIINNTLTPKQRLTHTTAPHTCNIHIQPLRQPTNTQFSFTVLNTICSSIIRIQPNTPEDGHIDARNM